MGAARASDHLGGSSGCVDATLRSVITHLLSSRTMYDRLSPISFSASGREPADEPQRKSPRLVESGAEGVGSVRSLNLSARWLALSIS